MEALLHASTPFVVAIVLLVLVGAAELLALLMGTSAFGWLDHAVHGDAPDGFLGWLHVGRAPLLAIFALFLTAFAAAGLALNMVTLSLVGMGTPYIVSVPVAIAAALPCVRLLGARVARLVPRDETYAVSHEALVGRIATMLGHGGAGRPAQAKVADGQGHTLYVMVEPDDTVAALGMGEQVLLVRQLAGTRFIGIPNPHPDLLI
jgi:hypothetical protein